MSQRRARMKAGCRPIYAGARIGLVPEHPAYWAVPDSIAAAVELLASDGQVEYEPSYARGAAGTFVPEPALQVMGMDEAAPARKAPNNPFGRKPRAS